MNQKLPKPLIVGLLASLATGIITLLYLKKNADTKYKLSKGTPQLHLDNPGTQDDFPKSPAVSEIG